MIRKGGMLGYIAILRLVWIGDSVSNRKQDGAQIQNSQSTLSKHTIEK